MNAQINTKVESLSYKGLLYERYPSDTLMSWNEAKTYVHTLKQQSMKPWRLATVEELEKLAHKPNNSLSKLGFVWSKDEEDYQNAWIMDFDKNLYYLRNKTSKFAVLCVQDTALKRSIKFF